jgi:hypothetical protein
MPTMTSNDPLWDPFVKWFRQAFSYPPNLAILEHQRWWNAFKAGAEAEPGQDVGLVVTPDDPGRK